MIPFVVGVATANNFRFWSPHPAGAATLIAGWCLAITLPLGLAYLLRGRPARWNAIAAVWVAVLGTTGGDATSFRLWHELGPYVWCLLGSIVLIAWGMLEKRSERINLGIAGFALTVMTFYFSSVMDKLDRATSLVGLGVLFLAGGWLLERTRRRLVARLSAKSA